MTREIELTRGAVALVDDEDYEMLSGWSWCLASSGYSKRGTRVGGRQTVVLMHRQILLPGPSEQVDHINHDLLDNRRCNLRLATYAENAYNRRPHGSSIYLGVCLRGDRRRWVAQINTGKRRYLGEFADEVDAALAYDLHAIEHHGEFARPNFLQPCERSTTR